MLSSRGFFPCHNPFFLKEFKRGFITLAFDLLFKPGSSSSSGGGGGSSILWEEGANAPIKSIANGVGVYAYSSGLSQVLYTAVRVPSTYVAGTQIFLNICWYSPDSSGTGLLSSTATLIRPETDAISSTTNQHTSTNSAVSLGAGTVNEPQAISLDLTDSSGQINSVAVSAGDLILVQLTRGSDTGSSDLQFIIQSSEGVFS